MQAVIGRDRRGRLILRPIAWAEAASHNWVGHQRRQLLRRPSLDVSSAAHASRPLGSDVDTSQQKNPLFQGQIESHRYSRMTSVLMRQGFFVQMRRERRALVDSPAF